MRSFSRYIICNTRGTRALAGGATAIESYSKGWGGMTLGNFVFGNRGLQADPDNILFQHEYGHYLQSQASGLFYLTRYGIPSLLSNTDSHNLHPVEQDANRRAFQYFNNTIEGYSGWGFSGRGANPIIGYNQALPYNDPSNQKALKDNRLRLSWHNFVFGPSVLIGGPINAWILNTR